MHIDKNITPFIIISEESILNALKKISRNKSRIIFTASESGVLIGCVTDGDFRRWLLNQEKIDLNRSISEVQNKNLKFTSINENYSIIESLFSDKIEIIPLIDENHRIVAVAKKHYTFIHIGKAKIGDDFPVFIVAEIGNNHNGSLEMAYKLVDAAVSSGANCAKFQMRDIEEFYKVILSKFE